MKHSNNIDYLLKKTTDAIENQSLESHYAKCNMQIEEIVHLVQGNLDASKRITIEALIVIDVHSMVFFYNILLTRVEYKKVL